MFGYKPGLVRTESQVRENNFTNVNRNRLKDTII
jgi:hypothetical protein